MRTTVVFVASLYHSGSTLLDMLLGQHPRAVGLGEIYLQMKLGPTPRCSCGRATAECPFWGPVGADVERVPVEDLSGRLRVVLAGFRKQFGQDRILVDSSKFTEALELVVGLPDVDVRVIHLVRDVRSWSTSLWDRDQRDRGANPGAAARLRALSRGATARFVQWYVNNRRIEDFLEQRRLTAMRIGYEELSFYPKLVIPRLCEFIGIDEVPAMYAPGGSHSHVAFGNPARHDAEKTRGLFYDNRWLTRTRWLLPSLLLQNPVMRYNARSVYGNVRYKATTAAAAAS